MSSTAPHKLAPHSSLCVFLGYSSEHKGYRCLELQLNRILISRHVVFDESFFPFSDMSTTPMAPSALDFLTDDHDLTASVPGARFVRAGTSTTSATHVVHGAVPVHGSAAAPEAAPVPPSPGPWSPGSSAASPVHPAQAVASSAPLHRRPCRLVLLPLLRRPRVLPVLLPLMLAHRLLPAEPVVQLPLNRSPSLRSAMRTPCAHAAR